MNAFYRGHAITGLEELSMVICMHLCLAASFPDDSAANHWHGELDGFAKTLRRWNKGKKGRQNYTHEIIMDALDGILNDESQVELIEAHLEAKGFDPEKLDLLGAREFGESFAHSVLKEENLK